MTPKQRRKNEKSPKKQKRLAKKLKRKRHAPHKYPTPDPLSGLTYVGWPKL